MAIGEIEFFGHAIAIFIGISLQIHGGGTWLVHALNQGICVFGHLLGIGVIDVIQIHVHDAFGFLIAQTPTQILRQGFQ